MACTYVLPPHFRRDILSEASKAAYSYSCLMCCHCIPEYQRAGADIKLQVVKPVSDDDEE